MQKRPPMTPGNYHFRPAKFIPERPEMIRYSIRTPKGFTLTMCQPNTEREFPFLPEPEKKDE